MSTPSPLSLRAAAIARDFVARGIRGGLPGWGHMRGPEVDAYQREAGVELPADRSEAGQPWSMAAQHAVDKAAEAPGEASSCPATADALEAAEEIPEHCRLPGPQTGAIGVLKHDDGKTGRAVRCVSVFEDGSVETAEGDADANGSAHGDHWGLRRWNPADGTRGQLLGWWDTGLAAAADPPAPPVESPADPSA